MRYIQDEDETWLDTHFVVTPAQAIILNRTVEAPDELCSFPPDVEDDVIALQNAGYLSGHVVELDESISVELSSWGYAYCEGRMSDDDEHDCGTSFTAYKL